MMPWDIPGLLIALAALLVSAVAMTLTLARGCPPTRQAQQQIGPRVEQLEHQIRIFSRVIEHSLAGRLHAPTHHDLDRLLQELADDVISLEDAKTLHRLIRERSTELQLAGDERPDLTFPRLLTLWSLEVRLAQAGQPLEGTDG